MVEKMISTVLTIKSGNQTFEVSSCEGKAVIGYSENTEGGVAIGNIAMDLETTEALITDLKTVIKNMKPKAPRKPKAVKKKSDQGASAQAKKAA